VKLTCFQDQNVDSCLLAYSIPSVDLKYYYASRKNVRPKTKIRIARKQN